IYVAPPGRHLVVEDGVMRLDAGPKENGHRPAVDPLFRSAAHQIGSQAVRLIPSGVLDHRSAGLRSLPPHGGIAIVQDPEDAFYAGMPQSAIEYANPDYVLPIGEIAPMLVNLLSADRGRAGAEGQLFPNPIRAGNPHGASGLTCPECNGALWEVTDG